jgi:hypothetical protein
VLRSSCGIAIADSKKSCACPPLHLLHSTLFPVNVVYFSMFCPVQHLLPSFLCPFVIISNSTFCPFDVFYYLTFFLTTLSHLTFFLLMFFTVCVFYVDILSVNHIWLGQRGGNQSF